MIQTLKDSNHKILSKIDYGKLPVSLIENDEADELIDMVIIDLETTGLNFESDEPISFAAIDITYNVTKKKLSSINDKLEQFQQPKKPLSEFIKNFTKISDEFLENKKFNVTEITTFLGNKLCVSHNAKFDKTFT